MCIRDRGCKAGSRAGLAYRAFWPRSCVMFAFVCLFVIVFFGRGAVLLAFAKAVAEKEQQSVA
eukprot:12915187-Alexandrium_andersonii.AAC.1